MSSVFSKSKEKRSRSSSNETNNSFVKNVTSRVSGLLPSSITKWFGSPSTSNSNGSAPAADGTDSSTEDEATENPITTQPPLKRMRFSSPGKYNHFASTDVSCVTNNVDGYDQCAPYNNSVQPSTSRTTFSRETNLVSSPVRASNDVDLNKDKSNSTTMKSQHTLSSVTPSVATKRKSIFDNPNNDATKKACARTASNTLVDPKAPCFKPALFGSSFYPGQTMYGGAASLYINNPNIKHRKVALVNESKSSENTSMSYSARRVMDLLENYSSPLMEAKRISQYLKSSTNDSLNESMTTSGSPYCPKSMSYKTQELHVPNIVSVLRLKQKSRIMESTNAARQIIASHSSTSDYVPYPVFNAQREQTEKESVGKFTSKVKSRVTRLKRGENDIETQIITPVNLPTAVLLIDKDNMPKFSFEITSSSTSTSVNTTPKISYTSTTVSKTTTSIDSTASIKPGLSKPESIKPETAKCSQSYNFSSPVRLSSDISVITTTPPKFIFGSPDRGVDKSVVTEKKDDVSSCVVGTPKEPEKIVIQKTKDWQCPDCWVFNKIDVNKCVCCGAKQPSKETAKVSKCSICKLADTQSNKDKCINCEKVQTNTATKSQISLVQNVDDLSKWKCEDCWVTNDENVDKCVCCGGKNPKKANATLNSNSTVNSTNIGDSNSEWKCDDCWIKNKMSVDKCVACGGLKPGAKKNSSSALSSNNFQSTPLPTSGTMKITAKPQPQTWECSSCLVRNENNRSKCVCCESDKPGSIKESDKKLFNFSKTPNMNFKFGIDLAAQEISSKSSDEKPAEVPKKPEISETNNNTLPKAPTFSFGVPQKKADNQKDTPKITNSESGKLNFTFGLPKTQASTESAFTPVFGSANKANEFPSKKLDKDDEKLQEVPKVDFAFTTAEKNTLKPLNSIFGCQVTSVGIQDKSISSSPSLLSSTNTTENKDPVTKPLTIQQPIVTSEQKTKQQSSFTFTAPEIKTAGNLFAVPATTTSAFVVPLPSATTSNVSLFQESETTTTTSSLFKKPETITTSTVSLFQKTDTTTTTAPPSLAATAPIFSFGNNTTTNAAPQPEKPKFNFTFGSNSTMFNNSFGTSSTENTNKFSLSGNRLAAGGNGLATGSALTGGNGLTAKLGSTNELPPNTLSQPALQPTTSIFGTAVQKENLWSSSNSNPTSLFASNASSAPPQKPATFSFGSTTPYNAGNSASRAFGNNTTTPQNVFGMNQNAITAPSIFSTPVQNQPAPSIFAPSSAPPASNSTPALGIFGSNNVAPSPTFATSTPTMPSFETPAAAPAPAFNFGAPQPSGIFGFGQRQQQPQQPQQAGVYSFGAASGAPQVQFNMGSANTGGRRMRKAVRRNPQR